MYHFCAHIFLFLPSGALRHSVTYPKSHPHAKKFLPPTQEEKNYHKPSAEEPYLTIFTVGIKQNKPGVNAGQP
jgi:hypothetical protein